MRLDPGDHVCALYRDERELAHIVADFLADGLRRSERCWYLTGGDDPDAVRTALEAQRVDTGDAVHRGALAVGSSAEVYGATGDFDPETTMAAFSRAIEQALSDGFSGLRAAANMSWALDLPNGIEQVITYEALMRSLFSSARATGLCLYDRRRMPLAVINGALSTHPVVRTDDNDRAKDFFDPNVHTTPAATPRDVVSKVGRLDGSKPDDEPPRTQTRRPRRK